MFVGEGMREVVYDFEEFREKVDDKRGIHHDASIEVLGGGVYKVLFRLFGVSRGGEHVIVFERARTVSVAERPELETSELLKEVLSELEKEYAEPLSSTPGRWEEGRGE